MEHVLICNEGGGYVEYVNPPQEDEEITALIAVNSAWDLTQADKEKYEKEKLEKEKLSANFDNEISDMIAGNNSRK